MTATSLRRSRSLAGLFAAVLACAGIAADVAPASAAPAAGAPTLSLSSVEYVALGDSYAAGQGALGDGDVCERTRLAYPSLLDLVPTVKLVTNAACTGATTAIVATTQLGALTSTTRLVTLTVGVNDLGLVQTLGACTIDPGSEVCTGGIAQIGVELDKALHGEPNVFSTAGVAVAGLLQAIRSKSPKAKIVVTGYPRSFEPVADQPLYDLVNTGTDALNQALAGAVTASGVGNSRFVDVTSLFLRHGVNSRIPWLIPSGPDAFHPNALGQAAYAYAVGKAAF